MGQKSIHFFIFSAYYIAVDVYPSLCMPPLQYFVIRMLLMNARSFLHKSLGQSSWLPGVWFCVFGTVQVYKPVCLPARRQVFLNIYYTRKYNFRAGKYMVCNDVMCTDVLMHSYCVVLVHVCV